MSYILSSKQASLVLCKRQMIYTHSAAWFDNMNTFKNLHRPLMMRLRRPQESPERRF